MPSLGDTLAALGSGDGVMTHVRTAAYFAAFLGALGGVTVFYPWRRVWRFRPLALSIATPYSLAALLATWRLILAFFVHHTQRYAGHPDPPNLFVDAYREVCDDAAGWCWSCVLLSWVCVACPLADAEARRARLQPRLVALFVTLAFLGAVSLAFPLLLLLLTVASDSKGALLPTQRVWLWPSCLALALASTAALPLTVDGPKWAFITALALLHVILIFPFAAALASPYPGTPPSPPLLSARSQYLALACVSLVLHLASLAAAWRDAPLPPNQSNTSTGAAFLWHLVSATWRNEAQASISIDAVLASLAGAGYMLARGGWRALPLVAVAPIVSPAAALAIFAAVNTVQTSAAEQRRPHTS